MVRVNDLERVREGGVLDSGELEDDVKFDVEVEREE